MTANVGSRTVILLIALRHLALVGFVKIFQLGMLALSLRIQNLSQAAHLCLVVF